MVYVDISASGIIAFVTTIFAVLMILAATGFMYKKWYIAVSETIFIFNLGILAIEVKYFKDSGKHEALVITSVGIAFLQFLATVIFHICVQLREPLKKFKIKLHVIKMDWQNNTRSLNGPEHEEHEPLDGASYSVEPLQRPPFQEIPNFREPLLGYLDD